MQLPECGKALSLWHSVFEGGSRWLSKDRPADPSEVMFVGALSCPAFTVTGTGTKGDGDAAAVTPACLSAECAHKSSTELELTMPDCISRGAVEFTR